MMNPMTRWYWIASAVPVIGAFYYVVMLIVMFGQLPTQTPIHFGLDGTPNGWLNRYAWAPLSLLGLAITLNVVFVTKPIAGDGAIAAWIYWVVSGLVIGSLVEANRAAAGRHNLQMWPLAVWAIAVPLLEFLLVKVAAQWLKGS